MINKDPGMHTQLDFRQFPRPIRQNTAASASEKKRPLTADFMSQRNLTFYSPEMKKKYKEQGSGAVFASGFKSQRVQNF